MQWERTKVPGSDVFVVCFHLVSVLRTKVVTNCTEQQLSVVCYKANRAISAVVMQSINQSILITVNYQ